MTNVEALRSILLKMEHEPTEEAIEFLDAIEEELNNPDTETIMDKNAEIERLESEIDSFEEWINPEDLLTIDCGIGVIRYVEPDNLKLQLKMEDLKEKAGKMFIGV